MNNLDIDHDTSGDNETTQTKSETDSSETSGFESDKTMDTSIEVLTEKNKEIDTTPKEGEKISKETSKIYKIT